MSGTFSFCSNTDALGIDESEKGIFYSLKNIALLPPGSPKEDDRLADSAAGIAESPAAGEAGKESSVAGTSEWLDVIDWFFIELLLMSLYFPDKQAEDQPKSPSVATKVDLILLETPQQEAEKPVGESAVVAQRIQGCHSCLAVSFFILE